MSYKLDDNQMKIATHTTGPALTLAGPGSGKTTVLTERTVRLSKKVSDPSEILCVTFTNAAGRRSMSSTPGNAEIVDEYPNENVGAHEIDEAFAGNVNLTASTGEDEQTNYIIIISIIAGIIIVAAGALVVKKYLIK